MALEARIVTLTDNEDQLIAPRTDADAVLYDENNTVKTILDRFAVETYTKEEVDAAVRTAAPRNLLDNSDFRNPVIWNDKTSGTATYLVYTVNRWMCNAAGWSVDSDGITITPDSSSGVHLLQQQMFENNWGKYVGKILTFAVCLSDGTVFTTSGTVLAGTGNYQTFASSEYDDLSLKIYVNSQNILICEIVVNTAITVQWAALYEGEYTSDTLPNYQPKGYENELLVCRQYDSSGSTEEYIGLCKVGPPRNLLDNSDFTNPVNQRRSTSYTGVGYTIDRWINDTSALTVTVSDGKVTLSKDTTGGSFYQKLPFDLTGKTVTYAIKTSEGIISKSCVVSSGFNLAKIGNLEAYFGIYATDGLSKCLIYFNTANAVEFDIYWAALYEGRYTIENLPEYQPKGYAAELLECQRYQYLLPIGPISGPFGVGYGFNTTTIRLFVPIPTEMRVNNPQIEYLVGDVESFTLISATSTKHATSVTITKSGYSGLVFAFTVSDVTAGEMFVVSQANNNLKVLVNANL